jgi:hypothetical protein
MIPARLSFAPYKTDIVQLKGGINENVSSLELQPGELIDVKNYMIAEGNYSGYLSIKGYERVDGATRPSTFESLIVKLSEVSTPILAGDVLVGAGGAEATAIQDALVDSGTYIEGTAAVFVQCLIDNAIEFIEEEEVSVLGSPIGSLVYTEHLIGGNSSYHAGLDYARSIVEEVPGEGRVLGVHYFNGKMYAWRKHIGADTIGMYVEDPTDGWLEIDTSADELDYEEGAHEFHFTNNNFFANVDSYSFFFVDGVNQGRMYNEVSGVTVLDNTGMSATGIDKPINVIAHNDYLFFAYRGGSLQHSVLGDPTDWTGASGAGEIACGAEITALITGLKGTLIVFMDEGIRILNGIVASDFTLETYSKVTGCFSNTAQRMLGTAFFIDDRGLSTLAGVDTFGDYAANTISQRFKRTLKRKMPYITTTITSRDLNQYRVFFEDKTGIIVSFEGQEMQGATFLEYPIIVRSVTSGDQQGDEVILFASDDGFVYRMDSGTSFDGAPIVTRMASAFYHYGSPRNWKNFKRATFEISGEPGQSFNVRADFDYNEPGIIPAIWRTVSIYSLLGESAVWGSSKWSEMVWGVGQTATNRVPLYIRGVGVNMSYKIISAETYRTQHTIQNIITDYEILSRRL